IPSLAKPANSFNNDCVVNLLDVEILTDDWLTSGYEFTVAAPPASDPNLELYYAFEGSLADGSGNGRTGEPNGTITYAAGKSGQAISFDGTNFVNVPDYNGVSGTQSRTCSAWIKATEPGEIVSWGNNTTGQKWIWRLQNETGGAEVTGAERLEVSNGQIVGSTDLLDDAWHHVAVVLDSDGAAEVVDLKLYVDGYLDASSFVTNQVINTADLSTVRVGRGPWNDRPFYGQIDELRVYSRALSHGEVASLAGYTSGTVLSQPVFALLSTLSDTDLNDDEVIDFKDFALLANTWLDELLWP
ncbi:MAG: LamG domain-containing protein, partial [Phycisphaerales bacterium]